MESSTPTPADGLADYDRTAGDAAAERATGSDDPVDTQVQPTEHPDLRGTLFLMTIFLMMIFGFWLLMYFELLNR